MHAHTHMQVEGINVTSDDTDDVPEEDKESVQKLLTDINSAANETALSSQRYEGEKWSIDVTVLVSDCTFVSQ